MNPAPTKCVMFAAAAVSAEATVDELLIFTCSVLALTTWLNNKEIHSQHHNSKLPKKTAHQSNNDVFPEPSTFNHKLTSISHGGV